MSAGSNDSELMVSRDLGRVAPAFRAAVEASIAECRQQGLDAMVYEAYRSQALAAMYYQRGRTITPPFKPVTNAPTNLHSWHGFGLAVDVVHRTKFWSPPEGDAWFHKIGAIFKKHGCTWGGDWKMADLPHFQWGRCPAGPSDAARQLIQSQGMQAVWLHFGAVDGTVVPAVLPPAPAPVPSAPALTTRTLGTIGAQGFNCEIHEDSDGRVHFIADADIDADGLADTDAARGRPAARVDAALVPFILVPPLVVKRTVGIVRGCKARVTWQGRSVDCVVVGPGPAERVGEISIAAARALGMPANPGDGGVRRPEVQYELWPGVAAPGFVLQKA